MPTEPLLSGVFVPVVTPFGADGRVELDDLAGLCSEALRAGAAGIVALGTTGEAPLLDADEKRSVIEVCSRICQEWSRPLIVGAGTNNTAASVAAVRELEGVPGLTAVLIVVPYYLRPSEAGIIQHLRTVAEASPAPVVVYNIPYRTGRVLTAPSLLELAAAPNVVGVKQAVGGVDVDTLEVLGNAPEGFCVLGGDDAFLFPIVLMGGTGAIAASAHLCTERFVRMIECGLQGRIEEGRRHAAALLPVAKALFTEPNPSVIKGVLHQQGRIRTPDLRLPMTRASDAAVEAAFKAVEQAAGF